MASKYWTVLISLMATVTLAAALCEYPAELQGKRFLSHQTAVPNVGLSQSLIQYKTNTEEVVLKLTNLERVISTLTCEEGVIEDNVMYYRRSTAQGDLVCSQLVITEVSLLYRDFETNVAWTPAECKEKFAQETEESSSWYLAYPLEEPTEDCPLPAGEYPLTYDDGTGVACDGDASSTATIAGNTITINSCFSGASTFEKPLNSMELKCAGSVEADLVQSGATDNGNILKLGDYSDFPNTVNFYCTRYLVRNGAIYLSLSIASALTVRCPAGQTYESKEDGTFLSIVLGEETPTTIEPTTEAPTTQAETTAAVTEAVTEAATTDASDDATPTASSTCTSDADCQSGETCRTIASGEKKCLAGCEPNPCQNNGNCSTTDEGVQCQCPAGYSGDTCQYDDGDDDDGDNDDLIILVILLLVLAFVIIAVTALAVAICQRKRRREEEEAKDYQSMHSDASAPADRDLANNKAWYPTYNNTNGNSGYY